MRRLLFLAVPLFLFLALQPAPGQQSSLAGRVVEAATHRGIPALNVKLIPSKELRESQQVTSTNSDGEFHFVNLRPGRYLLEIRQGVTLLHREVVTVHGNTTKEIALHRR